MLTVWWGDRYKTELSRGAAVRTCRGVGKVAFQETVL